MNPNTPIATLARHIAEMHLVGEIDHLTLLRQAGEQLERLSRTIVAEGLHDVVGDERQWFVLLDKLEKKPAMRRAR